MMQIMLQTDIRMVLSVADGASMELRIYVVLVQQQAHVGMARGVSQRPAIARNIYSLWKRLLFVALLCDEEIPGVDGIQELVAQEMN